jgi:hypothetical protein
MLGLLEAIKKKENCHPQISFKIKMIPILLQLLAYFYYSLYQDSFQEENKIIVSRTRN